ncbi:MAG TPA: pitrilysin family protein [Longimicrobiaceae bacterium]|nr:pitrilysin family protein [Longimicrobiaceae bacterium]
MRRTLLALAVAALLPAPALAQGDAAVRLDYVEETLPNGLKVIYHVDRSTPVAAVDIWYNVGSKHEQPGRTGFAHLFEHIMFKGSRNVPDGSHFGLLEDAGARAGADINGTTSFDRTNYFEQVPSNRLELALWLEADRMGTLLETLTPEKLDNQREVVKNERRQGVDNQPYGTWLERMLTHVFPAGHPYHHTVIGSMEDLTAASLDDVKNFFRTYYAPNNAVLVVAGDIDVEQAKQLVRKHFGDIPRGPAAPPLRSLDLPPHVGAPRREVVEDANAPAPAVYVGYRVPNARSDRADATSLLGSLLGSGRSSPLYESLVRRQQVATNVGAFNFGLVDGADLMVFFATGKPGASPDSLEAALLAELGRAGEAITEPALQRVKAGQRYSFVNNLQRTGGFGGRADMLAQAWTFHRDPNWVNTRLQALDRVTVPMLRALAAERLVENNRVTLVFVPRRAAAPPTNPGN